MRRRIALVSFVMPQSVACLEFGEGDAKVPGEELGVYAVTGELEQDSCKAAVLGVTDPWRFEIKLSRFQRDLYWLNGREAIVGEIAKDDVSFHFETRVDVDLEEARGVFPGCVIERADRADGRLSSGGSDVASFEGEMRFGYSQAEESDCSTYVGVEGGFAALPCTIGYAVGAVRTKMAEKP